MATTLPHAHERADSLPTGLSEAEAARRLREAGRPARPATSRSYASIVRANVFTVFNAILAAFGALTLIFGDWRDALFLGIIVANSGIGIYQEGRAKRALDRLALLVAPHARVVRDGVEREAHLQEVVAGDVVRLRAGDQVVADGTLLAAVELRLDESILTGESEPASRRAGEQIRSGSFAVEGTGSYEVQAVGADSFAARITGQARTFRHPRSPLELAVNRLLYSLVGLVLVLGGVLLWSLYHRNVPIHEAVATSSAGVVSLVPEGLIVLISLTYAAAAVRMAKRGILAQQLNAIESLASVEVICVDKTGTLTESSLRVAALIAAEGVDGAEMERILGRIAASVSAANATIEAIAAAYPAEQEAIAAEVPFSSRRRWSGVELDGEAFLLGAPERFALGGLAEQAAAHQREGRRVLALARTATSLAAAGYGPRTTAEHAPPSADRSDAPPAGGSIPPSADRSDAPPADGSDPPSADRSDAPPAGGSIPPSADGSVPPAADWSDPPSTEGYGPPTPTEEDLPADAEPVGIVVIAERLRPGIEATVAFLLSERVELKVLSGDAPATVASIAGDVGIPVAGAIDGSQLPQAPDELAQLAARATVIGRISPDGKQAIVQALHDSGRYVAMLGDGVNDVPALKASRLAIAQGSGSQMARSVSDLVLLSGDFAAIPALVGEGRRALRNLQRVAKLYVTKSAFAAFLILTIGLSSDAYPLLPRHLTLTAALTIGIPTFFLALAPSTGPWRPDRFVRGVARFAVPAGTIAGTGLIAGYLFALHDLDYSVIQSRTVATTVLIAVGLYLVLALEAAGSRQRSALVGAMCAVLAGLYVLALLLPVTRSFFQLATPTVGIVATGLAGASVAIAALALSGYLPIPAGKVQRPEPGP